MNEHFEIGHGRGAQLVKADATFNISRLRLNGPDKRVAGYLSRARWAPARGAIFFDFFVAKCNWTVPSKRSNQLHGSLASAKFYSEHPFFIAVIRQLNKSEEFEMPVILWLLGVPLSVIVIAALFGAF